MLQLIHGDNQVASRKKLTELLTEFKKQNKEVFQLSAEKLDRAQLESNLLSESLFGQEKILVLDGLHSLPKSKKKDEFINLISSASIDIILWEKKLLTKTDLKKLQSDLETYEFKITPKLWTFLDKLSPNPKSKNALLKLFHESIAMDGAEFIFLMMARQIRLLIQVKEGEANKLAPFMLSKLKKQAGEFSLAKLLTIHQQLYQIDTKLKQSTSLLSLEAELDLLLLNM
jgi:DNA polymerase III delta subunit